MQNYLVGKESKMKNGKFVTSSYSHLSWYTHKNVLPQLIPFHFCLFKELTEVKKGAQWLSGGVLDSRPRGRMRAAPLSLHCGP